MKFYNSIAFIFCICSQLISAFDVKVLLATVSKRELVDSPIVLKSSSGFFIAQPGEFEAPVQDKKIVVTYQDGCLYVNKNKMIEKNVSLRPQPSIKQKKDIAALVKDWIAEVRDAAEIDFEKLTDLCDQLVSQKKTCCSAG